MGHLFTTTNPKSTRYTMLWLLLFALLLCYIDRVLISMAAIEMQLELGWSESDKGLVLSSFFMGYLIVQLLGGILANRYGGRNILMAAVILWSLFTLLTPAAAYISFGLLLLTRFMLGIGEGAAYPATYNLIHTWMPVDERSRSLSMATAASATGTIVALLLSGAIIAKFGWPSVFYLFGSMGLVWAFIWGRKIPPVPLSPEENINSRTVPLSQTPKAKIPWRLLLTHRAVLTLYLIGACLACITYVLASWLPSYFVDTFGLTISQAGIYSLLPWGALTVITILAGISADKFIGKGIKPILVRKRLVLLSLLLIAFCMVIMTVVETPGMAVLVMCGVFAGIGISVPGYAPVAGELLPGQGEIIYGVMAATGSACSSILVFLAGVLLDSTGSYDTIFFGMAGLSLMGLLVFQLFAQASPISDQSVVELDPTMAELSTTTCQTTDLQRP